jgi:hypothetical protein
MWFSWNIYYIFTGIEMKDFEISWGWAGVSLRDESISRDWREGSRRRPVCRKSSLKPSRLAQCFPTFFLWSNPQNNFLHPEEPPPMKLFAGRENFGKEEPFCHHRGGGTVTIRNERRRYNRIYPSIPDDQNKVVVCRAWRLFQYC